jgi:pimeloyl-ACP methyl ester carboxylesterase
MYTHVNILVSTVRQGTVMAHALYVPCFNRASRKTMILVHGAMSTASTYCEMLLPLSRVYTIYAVDLPGFGHSQSLRIDAITANGIIEAYTDWLEAFCTTLVLGAVEVTGHSFGAFLGIQWAYRFPSRTYRLVLLSPMGGYYLRWESSAHTGRCCSSGFCWHSQHIYRTAMRNR